MSNNGLGVNRSEMFRRAEAWNSPQAVQERELASKENQQKNDAVKDLVEYFNLHGFNRINNTLEENKKKIPWYAFKKRYTIYKAQRYIKKNRDLAFSMELVLFKGGSENPRMVNNGIDPFYRWDDIPQKAHFGATSSTYLPQDEEPVTTHNYLSNKEETR